MKYELYDMIDKKYEYGLKILRIHNKIKHSLFIKALLILPIHNNIIMNIFFLVINSMSTIILCNDFKYEENQTVYLTKYLNFLTPYGWIERLSINNTAYLIICGIFIILCLIRTFHLLYITYRINRIHITKIYNIKINRVINIMNHITYIFFSYIIQFLSFIFYIEIFPDTFKIKKNSSYENINIAFIVINFIFIVIYNLYNYLFIRLAVLPKNDEKLSFQLWVPSTKFFSYLAFENLSLLQPLPFCLNKKGTEIWNICFSLFIIFISSLIYFISLKTFNYNNIINNIISFFGNFCFISLILELILYFSNLNYTNYKQLISFTLIKLIMALCLYYILDDIYGKLMIREVKRELFNKDSNNFNFNKKILGYILYLRDMISNNNPILIRAIKYFGIHQENCQNKYCSCKIIKFSKMEESDIDISLKNNKQQLIHFMDSILIQMDFNKSFSFAYIVSEHFYIFKKNYIMSYSILQTLLHNNHQNLPLIKTVYLYHTMEKYIKAIVKEKMTKMDFSKEKKDKFEIYECNKEHELKKYFNPILKVKKINKLMIQYATKKNELVKHKQNFESTIRLDIDENDGEIHMIMSPVLNKGFISTIIDYLKYENSQTKDLKKLLIDLKEFKTILSLEFLFKCILFIDYFWNAQIPNELIEILYGFSRKKNLYSTNVNSKIYEELKKKYNSENYNAKYFMLLKYTKGLSISYITESLIRKLNLLKENIKNKDLSSLFIKDLVTPHNKAVNQFFISKQHCVITDKKFHFFNNKKYMISNILNSTFQIGINKNILILCQIQLKEGNETVTFLANKNMEIISINQSFENKFNLSLALIEEFKIEIKDLFEVSKKLIMKKFQKEIRQIKQIRLFNQIDPKEYIIKNIFKQINSKESYKFSDENIYIIEKTEEDEDINNNYHNSEETNKLIKKRVKPSFIKMIQIIFNNQYYEIFHKKSINFRINKDVIINKMKKMMERISVYEQGKLESKNLYNDFLLFNQNYGNSNSRTGVYINLKITMKLIYDTPIYLCKVHQYEDSILNKEAFYFWENKSNNYHTKNDNISNSFINIRMDKNIKNILMDDSLKNTNMNEGEKIQSDGQELPFEKNEFLKEIRDKIKKNKISKNILRISLLVLILLLLLMYVFILIKKINLITQADGIFKTLFYTYYQRAQLLYINSVVLSIHFNLVNLTGNDTTVENREMLRYLSQNLEEGFHLFYNHYLDYKEGVNEDTEELYRQRSLHKITVNWISVPIESDFIREMQIILYYAMSSSGNTSYTEQDVKDCNYFLLGQFINNPNNNTTEINGTLIRLIYYLYENYDSVFENFFEELTSSFENSFNNFSNDSIKFFLCLETAGLLLYILFFLINFYFLFQANKYIFQNILCLFLDFTHIDAYNFNNKNENLLISQFIKNFISLLKEFTPKKLEDLHNASFIIENISINDAKEGHDSLISENKEVDLEQKLKEKNDPNIRKRAKSKATLNHKYFLNELINHKNPELDEHNNNIHDLNYSNLIKNYSSKNNTNTKTVSNLINKSYMSNNTTDKTQNQNNSSIININMDNSLMAQSKSNSNFNTTKMNNQIFYNMKENQNLNIEKIILSSKSIIIKKVEIILIIFVVLSVIYIAIYVVSIIIGFLIIKEIGEMYEDFRVLVSQYNEIIHYWNNMKTLFILPNNAIYIDIYNIEKYFSSLNKEVLNIISSRINNYKRTKLLYSYLFNAKSQDDLIKANFCTTFPNCYDLINSDQNVLLNGLNAAVSLYAKEIYNYYKDYREVKNNIKTADDIKKYFIKDNFIILGTNINHIICHIEEKFFNDFLADEEDIAKNYHKEIRALSLVSFFYCIVLNLYSLIFIFSYINQNIEFIETSTFRIVSSFSHLKNTIQNFLN